MVARTHGMIAFACLLSAAVYYHPTNLGWATVGLSLVANTTGSMLPDIDQASNKLWDLLPYGDVVGKFFSKVFLSHRSISHSILGLVGFAYLTDWLLHKLLNGDQINIAVVSSSLMIGFISHLMADGVTEEGLPLLFPLRFKFGFPPIKSWRIKTDHWFERYVVTTLVLIYIAWLVATKWNFLKMWI